MIGQIGILHLICTTFYNKLIYIITGSLWASNFFYLFTILLTVERNVRTGVVDVKPAVSTIAATNALMIVLAAVVLVATVALGHAVVL